MPQRVPQRAPRVPVWLDAGLVGWLVIWLVVGLLATGPAWCDTDGTHDTHDGPHDDAQRALDAVTRDDLPTALDLFEAALAEQPDDLRIGAEYRQAAIAAEQFDRAIEFFEQLVADHPDAGNAHLNLGYAFVDKIPVAGAVTQVILANTALGHFSRAVELEPNWLRLYTRGNSYLYWPAIFGRTDLGISDLERAIELAKHLETKTFHAFAHTALGDGHWRLGEVEEARRIWRRGLEFYPGDARIQIRLALDDAALDEFLEAYFSTDTRVETHMRQLTSAR